MAFSVQSQFDVGHLDTTDDSALLQQSTIVYQPASHFRCLHADRLWVGCAGPLRRPQSSFSLSSVCEVSLLADPLYSITYVVVCLAQ